ncbi:contactin-6-like isoform X2 [Bolinopsis microptera]|uniref:contactin-6-like isoform X2 n=1 Tax=Bolinopsis microptera TaxID=2820187 RepID=UPI00307A56CC
MKRYLPTVLILVELLVVACSVGKDAAEREAVEREAVAVVTGGLNTVVVVKESPPTSTEIPLTTVIALESLIFLEQPEDKDVNENTAVRLACRVQEVQGASYVYEWFVSPDLRNIQMHEDNKISGADGPELFISSVQSHHAGQYICTVTVQGTNFTVISNTGQLKINYYDGPRESIDFGDGKRVSVQKNKDYQSLSCILPESYPKIEAVWYKNGEKIADERRMFILPRETYFGRQKIFGGALIIMYIDREDKGVYDCKTTYNGTEYLLQRYTLRVVGEVQASNLIKPSNIVTVDGESTYGGQATLYCSGIGKPAPRISWNKMDGSRVETSEKFLLQDNRRRLVITNVNSDDGTSYTCSVTVGGAGKKTQIVSMDIIPPVSAQITFVEQPKSQIIFTNRYPTFSLKCSINLAEFIGVEGSMMPVLYWLKNGNQLGFSSRRKSTTRQDSETNVLESSIEFVSPNESDLGIYQCIARGITQLRQVTAYVNVRSTEGDYNMEVVEPKYDFISVPMTVSAAEEHCRSWMTNGHLVSIMSRKEADTVTRLLKQENIEQAWIGLTCERYSGTWLWTQPADDSSKFSFWAEENPDNLYAGEEYAIMDTSLEGRWLDVRLADKKYPFVCKQYTKTCPSIREYYSGKLEPLNKVESKDTRYGVGESITVTCVDRTVQIKETLTCTTSGKYYPDEGFACPVYSSAPSQTFSSFILLVSVISRLIIRLS